jgi:hypothetical protein
MTSNVYILSGNDIKQNCKDLQMMLSFVTPIKNTQAKYRQLRLGLIKHLFQYSLFLLSYYYCYVTRNEGLSLFFIIHNCQDGLGSITLANL